MADFIKTPFAVEGDVETIPEAMQTNGAVSMRTGYTFDYERDLETDPDARDIGRAEFNWLMNLVTTALHQYQTEGAFPFITAAMNGGTAYPYKKGARCFHSDETMTGIFESLVGNNTAPPTDSSAWKRDGDVSWNEIDGKPGTFPPSVHNHDAGDITAGILAPGRGGTGRSDGKVTALATARTITVTGGATGTATPFDGSANIAIPITDLDMGKATAGTLGANRGGTGRTDGKVAALVTARTVRTNLASTTAASFDGSANITPGVTGILPIPNGGTGNATGLAASATRLATARTIGGVPFDGSANINLPGVNAAGNQSTSGNAASATKLATARTIALTGDVTGSASFNGTANAGIAATWTAKPKLTAGLGQIVGIQYRNVASMTVPAGGTWFCYILAFAPGSGGLYNNQSGLWPGGTTLKTAGVTTADYIGIAWRIA